MTRSRNVASSARSASRRSSSRSAASLAAAIAGTPSTGVEVGLRGKVSFSIARYFSFSCGKPEVRRLLPKRRQRLCSHRSHRVTSRRSDCALEAANPVTGTALLSRRQKSRSRWVALGTSKLVRPRADGTESVLLDLCARTLVQSTTVIGCFLRDPRSRVSKPASGRACPGRAVVDLFCLCHRRPPFGPDRPDG